MVSHAPPVPWVPVDPATALVDSAVRIEVCGHPAGAAATVHATMLDAGIVILGSKPPEDSTNAHDIRRVLKTGEVFDPTEFLRSIAQPVAA